MSTATEDSSSHATTTIGCLPRPRIFLRLLNSAEMVRDGKPNIGFRQVNSQMMALQAPEGEQMYTFRRIFQPDEGESQIFQEVGRPLLQQLIQGQSPLLMMQGDMARIGEQSTFVATCLQELFKVLPSKLSPHCLLQWNGQDGFELCKPGALAEARVAEAGRRGVSNLHLIEDNRKPFEDGVLQRCSVFVSYLQVYNNSVFDLLAKDQDQTKPLLVKQFSRKSETFFHPSNSNRFEIRSADEGVKFLLLGEQARRLLNAKLNAQEERCHTTYTISLVQAELLQQRRGGAFELNNRESICWSHLTLVDSAGNKLEGTRQDNSLQTLRECVKHLRQGEKFFKQRQSRLTQLLSWQLEQANGVNLLIFLRPMDHLYKEVLELLDVAKLMDDKPTHSHVEDNCEDFDSSKLKVLLLRGRRAHRSMKQTVQRLRHGFMSIDNSMCQLRTDNSALLSSHHLQQKQAKDMEIKLKSQIDFNNQLLLQLNQARQGIEELRALLGNKEKLCSIQEQTIALAKDRIKRMRRSYESREQYLVSMQSSKVTQLRVQLHLKEEELKKLRRNENLDETLHLDGVSVEEPNEANSPEVSKASDGKTINSLTCKIVSINSSMD